MTDTTELRRLLAEHRLCGLVRYDGCYAHWPTPHCRADGTAWPCDVESLGVPALLDELEQLRLELADANLRAEQQERFKWVANARADRLAEGVSE